jgi:small subunit ribosomal protein S8
MTTDPLADFLTQLRNANQAGKRTVKCPFSKLKSNVARVLKHEGYISSYETEREGNKQWLVVSLKASSPKSRPMVGLRRISRPGRRVYVGAGNLPRVLGGLGIAIVSTPQGVMADHEARKRNAGGELLCHVW